MCFTLLLLSSGALGVLEHPGSSLSEEKATFKVSKFKSSAMKAAHRHVDIKVHFPVNCTKGIPDHGQSSLLDSSTVATKVKPVDSAESGSKPEGSKQDSTPKQEPMKDSGPSPMGSWGIDVKITVSIVVLVPAIIGVIWSLIDANRLRGIVMTVPEGSSKEAADQLEKLVEISGYISEGAVTFLWEEYMYLAVYIIIACVALAGLISIWSCITFFVGAIISCICGYIGMKTAVFCNVRTTYMAWQKGLDSAFDVAVRGGSIMGFCLVSLGVISLYILMLVIVAQKGTGHETWEALAGFGLGGSSIALFSRVGGGIYTKAADVGADLSGKNEYGMEEDDPRNPACIADNVGDNVGDIAGMGADLFGSFAESTCAALVIAGEGSGISSNWAVMCYPVMISSLGIAVGLVTLVVVRSAKPVNKNEDIESCLKWILFISTLLQSPVLLGIAYIALPQSFSLNTYFPQVLWWHAAIPVLAGLWAGLIIGVATEYYTSHSYGPVRQIAESQKTSAATGIIFGLALGYNSCIIPSLCLGAVMVSSFLFCGMFGVALGALGMLSTLTMGLTIDGFGPIADNAGGLAEMAELPSEVRDRTDALDAAGNTTAAVGKGFAIGSAALVSLALFGAFCKTAHLEHIDLWNPWCFLGLLLGALLPFWFSAMTMKSVGQAANEMVQECFAQFPKILHEGMRPNYQRCISISTAASLKEMIAPGCLVVLSPILVGIAFGKLCTAGLLAGAMTTGVMMAVSMSNSGGAWDNSKKYIKAGGLGEEHKKNETHKNSVTGDTVGDPMKDTSGPSLNILMKLCAITSLIFAPVIVKYSGHEGGPGWVKDVNSQLSASSFLHGLLTVSSAQQ
jgi:inorganic pyrophosphatase